MFVFALALPARAALPLQVTDDALTPAQIGASREILDQVARRLPPAWIQALDRRIEVEWRDDLPGHVHGRARGRHLQLNRALLDAWIARPADAAADHPATRATLAAIVHELAHHYDRTPQGRLSRDPRLLDLAGWQVSPMRLGVRHPRNAFSDRSPDRYELTNSVEFVAVNLEYFVLDPAYACRRPALSRHFAAHFGIAPPQGACAPDLVYLQPGDDAQPSPLLQLDPARVHAVDYLFAEGNDRAMSRWGHSMLRLVICAPGRAPGPDCRLDLAHHRVLSFRAFVDDVQISSLRGLTGSYPSRLFVLPFDQVIDEYTQVQLRGLRSIPLRLERDEIAMLLERAAHLHWNYDGRYYFLSNNCAVETFKLLHDGVPRLAAERLGSITPTALLRRLRRADIADTTVLENPAEALRLGYYFAPASAHYQAMFEVARQALDLPRTRVEDWLDLPPDERTDWLQRADPASSTGQALRTSAALLLLEKAALRRHELLARDDLKRRLLGRGAATAADDAQARAALQEYLGLEGLLSRPAALLPAGGYGLPQDDEREALRKAGAQHVAQWRQQGARLRDDARRWLPPPRRAALDAVEANIALIGERLRDLHHRRGGMSLE